MYTLRMVRPGQVVSLFEGTFNDCMWLANGLQAFPLDVVCLEIWDCDTCTTCYKWTSPKWC